MMRARICFVVMLLTSLTLIASDGPIANAQSQPAPRTLTVLVSGGQDTAALDGFFPQTIRVRVGDTVTWKFNGDPSLPHTVTLIGGPFPGPTDPVAGGTPSDVLPGRWVPVPSGGAGELMRNPVVAAPTRRSDAPIEAYDGATYVNSGELSTRPRSGMVKHDTFSVTFTKPGTYRYYCLIHRPHMVGFVEVLPAASADVPDQAQIDAQAKVEMVHLLTLIEKSKGRQKAARSLPGPNGITFWFVRSGAYDVPSAELRGAGFDFLPKNLTIKTGDTVIWESVDGHTVTFIPSPPIPPVFIVKPQPGAYPHLVQNPQVFRPAKPAPTYDPAQHFNSGPIGQTTPVGTSWALTFDKPGVYDYFCAFHEEMGMKGSITVVER